MTNICCRFRRSISVALAVSLAAVPPSFVGAEDIDLFVGNNPNAASQRPNVLVVLDNSANWNANNQGWEPSGTKQGEAELRALRIVAGELTDGINFGFMMFTAGSGAVDQDGGYIRFAIRQMTAANKLALQQQFGVEGCIYDPAKNLNSLTGTPNCILGGFNTPESTGGEMTASANTNYSAAMFEAFKYFGGYTNPANATKDIPGTPVVATVPSDGFGPYRYGGQSTAKFDPAAFIPTTQRAIYNPPINATNNCAKNYIIFIGNGFADKEPKSIPALLTKIQGDTTQLSLPQFTTATTTSSTNLGTYATCSTNAQCVTQATSIGPAAGAIAPFTCVGGTQITPVTQVDTVCESSAACVSRAETTFGPGYASYTCSGGTSTGGPVSLGNHAVCSTNAQCETQATTEGKAAGLTTPFFCSGGSPNIGSTVTLLASTGPVCETPAECQTRLAGNYPGYNITCSLGNTITGPGGCTGQRRVNQVVTATTCASGNQYNQEKFGTSAAGACPAPNLVNQTMTATPASVCTGSNFVNQTMYGSQQIITVTPTGNSAPPAGAATDHYADEWAKYLFTTDVNSAPGQQNIRTYTIDVFKDAQNPDQTALLYNMAVAGGGKYFQASSLQGILDALRSILIEIQAENSVFAAASLPVSATNRTQNENQVFFGLFRPDGDARPRWYGNLKRYQIAKNSVGQLILADQTPLVGGVGVDAINPSTGFFAPCAASFWTTDSGTYWSFSANSAGTCATATTSVFSDLPDGPMVEKGGAAEIVRRGNDPTAPTTLVNRTMYTCSGLASGSCPTGTGQGMVAFNNTNVSQAALGAATTTERDRIIDYTLGYDLAGENVNQNATNTRPSIHGDVVHSRPLAINYGGTAGVVIYYGGNDGPFRAVRTSDGKELWSFVAPEHHSRFKRLLDNSPVIAFPNVLALNPQPTPAPAPKDYFFDGNIGVYQTFDDTAKPPTSTKAWIFPTMHRGGRSIYAFDVTSATAPILKWRVGCDNATPTPNCTTGMDDIGQTWSMPNVAFIKGYGTTTPAIVVGGGYDTCEDQDTASPSCGSAKGRKVYVLNADTGAVIRSFDTVRSVPADVALIDRNNDGFADHAYVADTGGNVYRIDFVNPVTLEVRAPADWTITTIAGVAGNSARKFLFPPAVLPLKDRVILTLGSGDRQRPLVNNYPFTTPVANRFYAFVDLLSPGPVLNLDDKTVVLDAITKSPTQCLPDIRGWSLDLTSNTGEQTVTSSLITEGKVFWNTHAALAPAPGVCNADLGAARGYGADLFCGSNYSVPYTGGGLAISPVQGTTALADGTIVTFCIGCASPGATNPFAPTQIKPVITPTRSRLYWYRPGDK